MLRYIMFKDGLSCCHLANPARLSTLTSLCGVYGSRWLTGMRYKFCDDGNAQSCRISASKLAAVSSTEKAKLRV